ncbi:hypothetical protein EGW08_009764 [Elysia chlorotica]|uniref:ZSWIM3 N-terminal domain-containing protein n=1 Tax=Elysia chlorotica TaxID=188477 RepID=A0A3S0ZTJ6_ELYCH|nr:hypothetical protein EGW08_009764 [Elysia chlorotica]
MYAVEVQGNISVLPTPPANPESLLEGTFSTLEEFETNLHEFEKATFAVFRKNNTVSVQTARKYVKQPMPDEIVYHRAQYVCTHFGQPRYRGKGVVNRSTTLATGCEAEIVLAWNNYVRKLVVSKKTLTHNHEVNAFTYSQQYKVKRLSREQKEEIKELMKRDSSIRGHRLRDIVNSKFNKCFSLRDASLLKHQLKKTMTQEEKELLDDARKPSLNHTASNNTAEPGPEAGEAPRARRAAVTPPVFPDPSSVTDVSQFVSYLEESNRLKRRSEDSQVVDLLQSSYMIRKPNLMSVKKRKRAERKDVLSQACQTKNVVVVTDPTGDALVKEEEDTQHHDSAKGLSQDKEVQIFLYNNLGETAATKQEIVVHEKDIEFERCSDLHETATINDGDDDGLDPPVKSCESPDRRIQQSRNYHFFMDLCCQVDTLDPKTALRARQELSRVVHRYMMASL